jgi:hypothetical protein
MTRSPLLLIIFEYWIDSLKNAAASPFWECCFPSQNFSSDQVSLSAQIRKDRDITVNTFVRPGKPFLFRLGIIEGTDVNIQRRQLALRVDTVPTSRAVLQIKRADSSLTIPSKAPLTIQPLPEGRTGRTLLDPRAYIGKGKRPETPRLPRIPAFLFTTIRSSISQYRYWESWVPVIRIRVPRCQ